MELCWSLNLESHFDKELSHRRRLGRNSAFRFVSEKGPKLCKSQRLELSQSFKTIGPSDSSSKVGQAVAEPLCDLRFTAYSAALRRGCISTRCRRDFERQEEP